MMGVRLLTGFVGSVTDLEVSLREEGVVVVVTLRVDGSGVGKGGRRG